MQSINEPYTLIQTIVDSQKDLIILMENEKPILLNSAFMKFFGVRSFEQYSQEFGGFLQNFVPHPSYFHAEKVQEHQTWIEAILELDEDDRIVSMLNKEHEPRAFKVHVDTSHPNYAILRFEDISADLIKRIMVENNVSIDKKSGAFNKEYFLYTSESFYDGAMFNEKKIGLTLITIEEDRYDDNLHTTVANIKRVIRQNDMLVKYSKDTLLLAYLVENSTNAQLFSTKLFNVVKKDSTCKIILTLVQEKESIKKALNRALSALDTIYDNELKCI